VSMGISRDSLHKRRETGGKRATWRKKRKYELGRPAAQTKLAVGKRIHTVRTRGGHTKWRALRLESGTFSWASEGVSKKSRVIDVVYNASNNELVRTKTLVKGAIVLIDATPFRQWYDSHYGVTLGTKKGKKEEIASVVKRSRSVIKKTSDRAAGHHVAPNVDEQFNGGRLLVRISSRPGQSGRCDGYVLEGEELNFYVRKLKARKGQ